MTRLKASCGQFGLIGGICRATSDSILVVEPGPASFAARRKGNLYLLAEPGLEGVRSALVLRQVLSEISQAYYDCPSPSITTCLNRAIQQANRSLVQRNLEVSAHEKVTVGVTCAVVRGQEVFLAQVLPGQAYLVHQGRLSAFPLHPSWSPENAALPAATRLLALGWEEEVRPEFFHSALSPGDVLCLCSSNIGRFLGREEAEQLLLYQEPGDVVEQLYRRLHAQGFADAHALVVCLELAAGGAAAPWWSARGLQERARLALETIASWASFLGAEARRLFVSPRPAPPKPAARRAPARPEPGPEVPSLARPKPAAPWWKSLAEALRPQAGLPRVERPRLRIRPAREKRRLLMPFLLGLGAVLVLALLIGLIAQQQQRTQDARTFAAIAEAEQLLTQATQTRDLANANALLNQAEQRLSQAQASRRTRIELERALAAVRVTRDQINQVLRIAPEELVPLIRSETLSATVAAAGFGGGCASGCLWRDLVVLDYALFLLEEQHGTVYVSTTRELRALLGPGARDGPPTEPIVAIARLERPADCSLPDQPPIVPWLAAVDAARHLYLYRQGTWETYELSGEGSWKARAVRLEGFQGNVYVLRGGPGQILKFPCNAYALRIEWLQQAEADPQGGPAERAVDLAIDGAIHLLQPDGSVLTFRGGRQETALSYQVYPSPISPVAIYADPDTTYVYIADRRGRILQLRKEGAPVLVQQIRGPSDDDLLYLQAIAVQESQGVLYLLTERGLFRARVPLIPNPVPTPKPTKTP
jgi:serine/threonine protein phosphatase PrpC